MQPAERRAAVLDADRHAVGRERELTVDQCMERRVDRAVVPELGDGRPREREAAGFELEHLADLGLDHAEQSQGPGSFAIRSATSSSRCSSSRARTASLRRRVPQVPDCPTSSPITSSISAVSRSSADVMRIEVYGRVRKKSNDAAATTAAIAAATRSPVVATATTTTTRTSTRVAPCRLSRNGHEERGHEDRQQRTRDPGDGVVRYVSCLRCTPARADGKRLDGFLTPPAGFLTRRPSDRRPGQEPISRRCR